MPDSKTTNLKAQYAAKVTDDLEQNTAEQERIRAEIDALQARLTSLEQDRELLLGMSAALGDAASPQPADVPGPRRVRKAEKTTAPAKKAAPKAATSKKAAAATGEKGPAVTDLVLGHLSRQDEPRTAAEIAKALADAHPGRKISDNVVRTSAERLVARSKVERAKQGATVYYTATAHHASGATPAEREKAMA
ncbi:hypothetical protein HRW18_33315 [Streptomyces lunaelactis]|uniref:hypothetical protein n=1 Tax=Streptomyces lunaelactis TaxID=1535768 RepID=UPI0015851E8D|nr:hypothetical protein [Streptomyces lunaelactis]NUK12762.1 hypothetical protein [Streptomyces lunaelactis]NUK51003.1 hypothetical protein [Streptomyces lunaelactis]NUK58278.1 hypothetical protein [Streptomyces lunaelactis]NUK62757.1 hypothetical protein [Streptomyces lunaelactis]NUL08348.1 hypothetical protein [Streptomyces lunaelactis]